MHLLEGVAELRTGALLDDNRFIFPAVVAAALEREQDELGPPTIELGRRALRALGGNRSAPLTRVTRPPATPRRWAYQTPRRAFEDLQLNLFHEPPDAVLARFADARRERPELPYPYTYGAELLLWLGRYEEAAALLEEAWRRFKTRWAYVGAGAAQGLLGRPGRALDWWKRGAAQFQGMLDAEATYAYRGELYLVHDKPERARQELRFALRHRPSRVASWAALALSGLRVHDRDEAARALAELTRRAPALIWEARRARGLPPQTTLSLNTCSEKHVCSTLEAALELARGNRSSKLLTFVDARGRLRVCGDDHATRWRALAGRARSVARDALIEQALARPPATPGPR
ncbi:MAG: hypothetical protein H6713_16835 [Myxococcales bacterium]|nr:hypothetical protein [Myxococcales bacterium]